jgi:hypothetical protein
MRAFIPEGLTLRRAGWFDKRSKNRKWNREKRTKKLYHRGHGGHREEERVNAECAENAEFAEKIGEEGRMRDWVMG